MSKILVETDWIIFLKDYGLDIITERKFNSWLIKNKNVQNLSKLISEEIEAYWDEYQEQN